MGLLTRYWGSLVARAEEAETFAPMAGQLAHLMVVDVLATATAIAIGPRAIDTDVRRTSLRISVLRGLLRSTLQNMPVHGSGI